MGYAPDGRARFVDPAVQDRVYINVGDGLGTVLVAGKAVAAWSSSFAGNRLDVTLDVFDPVAEPHIPAIHARFDEVAIALEGKSATVKPASSPLAASLSYNRGGKKPEE